MNGDFTTLTASPADVLYYENPSMLDTIFVSKSKKKPVWITITTGPQTSIFSVSSSGKLSQTAAIHWQAQIQGSKKTEIMVDIQGDTFPASKFGQQTGGFYGKTSTRQFVIDNMNCQWTCRTPMSSVAGNTTQPWQLDTLLQWECTTDQTNFPPADPMPSTSKLKSLFRSFSADKSKLLLASYLGSGPSGPKKHALLLFPAGVPYTALLLISAIFTNTDKDHWKKQQSKVSPVELEAMLSSDVGGALPAYTPVRDTHSSGTVLHPTVPTTTPSRWLPHRPRSSGAQPVLPDYAAA